VEETRARILLLRPSLPLPCAGGAARDPGGRVKERARRWGGGTKEPTSSLQRAGTLFPLRRMEEPRLGAGRAERRRDGARRCGGMAPAPSLPVADPGASRAALLHGRRGGPGGWSSPVPVSIASRPPHAGGRAAGSSILARRRLMGSTTAQRRARGRRDVELEVAGVGKLRPRPPLHARQWGTGASATSSSRLLAGSPRHTPLSSRLGIRHCGGAALELRRARERTGPAQRGLGGAAISSCSFPCSSRQGQGAAADAPPRSLSSLSSSPAPACPSFSTSPCRSSRHGREVVGSDASRPRGGAATGIKEPLDPWIWRTRGADGKMQGVSRPPLQAGFLQKPIGKGWRRFCRTPVRVV
jgi:hypothetical protein